jgi:hypothetical protein
MGFVLVNQRAPPNLWLQMKNVEFFLAPKCFRKTHRTRNEKQAICVRRSWRSGLIVSGPLDTDGQALRQLTKIRKCIPSQPCKQHGVEEQIRLKRG